MYVCHVCAGAHQIQERVSDPLEWIAGGSQLLGKLEGKETESTRVRGSLML